MEEKNSSNLESTIDPISGFCSKSKIFHSLRPKIQIPLESENLSVTSYAFSLLPSPLPDHNAFVNATTGYTLSYPTLRSQINSLANALRSPAVGIKKGDVAFVLSPTSLEIPVLYFALLSIGAIVCPSNPILTQKDISRQIDLVGVSIAFVTSNTAHLIPSHVPKILLDSPKFQSFLAGDVPAETVEEVVVRQSDTAVILFSSGTSGVAKAAAASHRNYIAMIASFSALRESPSSSDVMLLIAPMFHSLGFFFSLKGVALGDTTVVMGRAGLLDMLRVAEKHRVTKMTTSPPMVVAMSRLNNAAELDLGSLKKVICGGAPLEESAAQRFISRFPGVLIEQGYGSTEGGSISAAYTEEECRNFKSVGRLHCNVEAKVVDIITDEVSEVGQKGELHLRGPTIMKGYLNDIKANALTIDCEGWLKTGDLAYIDSKGYLHIVDRLKELIKYKAYQVPPVELEQVLLTLPDVIDAAVVPYPDEESGQLPMAFVVRQEGSNISASDIMATVAKQVAPYKKIRKVAFVDSIPKTPSGKILRRELANQAVSNAITSQPRGI